MTIFFYVSLETIFHVSWSIKKKVILVICYAILFVPQGPARFVVKDHTWIQIYVAIAIGAFLGTIFYLFSRFVVQRYLLERIFTWKITRFLQIKNDYQPDFNNSVYNGQKYNTFAATHQPPTEKEHRWEKLEYSHIMLINSVVPFLSFCLGIIGIVFGILKLDGTINCGLATGQLLISTGAVTLGYVIFLIGILIVLHLRLKKKKFVPNMNQTCWFLATFLWFQALVFFICLVYSVTTSPTCTNSDLSFIYVFVFAATQLAMIVYLITIYYALQLWSLYTSMNSKQDRFGK
jgi:hypothetical protein